MADNVFSTAQIRVEAETSKAEQALKDLRGKMDELGKNIDDLAAKQRDAADAGAEFAKVSTSLGDVKRSLKDVSDLMSVLAKLEAPVRIARDFFQLGTEIEAVAEKLLGFKDVSAEALQALADQDKTPLQRLKKELQDAQKDLLDPNLEEQAKRSALKIRDALTGGTEADQYDQKKLDKLKDLNDQIQRQELEAIRKRTEQNRKATLEGVEKIEADKRDALEAARQELNRIGVKDDEYLNSISEKFDRLKEKETKKELEEIEKRKNAYMDLIRKQEAAEIQSKQRIADATEQMTTRVLTSISQQFEKLFDIRQMTMTLEAVNANLKALVNKRQGF